VRSRTATCWATEDAARCSCSTGAPGTANGPGTANAQDGLSVERSERLIAEIREEFPGFRILSKKDSRLSWWIDRALKLVTLGAQRDYLERYHTVIGSTLYVPRSWQSAGDIDRLIVLRHERVHLRQQRRYGQPLMALIYLLPFFPLGLAYGRARLEWEAYAETIRATAEYRGIRAAADATWRREIVSRFTSGAYGWMWPFRTQVGKWFDAVIAELEQQPHANPGERPWSPGAGKTERSD
jgi:hypothetical protein